MNPNSLAVVAGQSSSRVSSAATRVRSINGDRLVHRLGAIDSDVSNRVATIIKTLLNY